MILTGLISFLLVLKSGFAQQLVEAPVSILHPTQMEIGRALAAHKEMKWFVQWKQASGFDPSIARDEDLPAFAQAYAHLIQGRLDQKPPLESIVGVDYFDPLRGDKIYYPCDGHHRVAQVILAQERIAKWFATKRIHAAIPEISFKVKVIADGRDLNVHEFAKLLFVRHGLGQFSDEIIVPHDLVERFQLLAQYFNELKDNPYRSLAGNVFQTYGITPHVDFIPYVEFLVARLLKANGVNVDYPLDPEVTREAAVLLFNNGLEIFKPWVRSGHQAHAEEMLKTSYSKLCEDIAAHRGIVNQ